MEYRNAYLNALAGRHWQSSYSRKGRRLVNIRRIAGWAIEAGGGPTLCGYSDCSRAAIRLLAIFAFRRFWMIRAGTVTAAADG